MSEDDPTEPATDADSGSAPSDETDATKREGHHAKRAEKARVEESRLERGASVDRYIVLDVLGAGGMGVVYAAYDPELDRKVAIKLLQDRPSGGPSSADQTSLLREAQALARLSHPNVIAIHDVGTLPGDLVFIAIELVEGSTLRAWLKKQPRHWREVRPVMQAAGAGLAAAHAAGLVHRDFKPENVLVGDDGRVRVMDFGLARMQIVDATPASRTSDLDIESRSPLSESMTVAGMVVGTPAYMAPEIYDGIPASPRTDQFAFGVTLYEALYGTRPFAKDALKSSRDIAPTPKDPPSSDVPARLERIAMRAISIAPELRFGSMNELLAALSVDPTAQRRRRVVVTGLVLAISGVVVAGVVTQNRGSGSGCDEDASTAFAGTWSEPRKALAHSAFLKTGKPYAEAAFSTTAAHLDHVAGAWKAARVDACRETRELHQQSEADMLLRMTCLERQRAELAAFVELLRTADGKMVELAPIAAGRLGRPDECDDARSLATTAKPPSDPKVRAEIESLRLELASASALPNIGRPRDAITRYQPLAARAKAIGYRPLEAEAFSALGTAYYVQADFPPAIEALEAAVLAAEAGHMDRLAARASLRLASLCAFSSRNREANSWVARSAAIVERLGGDRVLEAEIAFARGIVSSESAHHEDAISDFLRALPTQIELLGPDHTDTLITRVNLGASYDELAQPKQAIEQDAAAIAGFERTLGPDHPRLVVVLANLAMLHMRVGELAAAEPLLDRAHAIAMAALGPNSRKTAIVLLYLSKLRLEQGRADEAISSAREAAAIFRDSAGEGSDEYGDALIHEGAGLFALGKAREAADLVERGIGVREKPNPDKPGLADNLALLGESKLALGKASEAVPVMERALKLAGSHPVWPGDLAHIRLVAAEALVASHGDRTRARELAQQAREELAPLRHRAAMLARVDALLARAAAK